MILTRLDSARNAADGVGGLPSTIAMPVTGFGIIGLREEWIAVRYALVNAANGACTDPSREAVWLANVEWVCYDESVG